MEVSLPLKGPERYALDSLEYAEHRIVLTGLNEWVSIHSHRILSPQTLSIRDSPQFCFTLTCEINGLSVRPLNALTAESSTARLYTAAGRGMQLRFLKGQDLHSNLPQIVLSAAQRSLQSKKLGFGSLVGR